MIIFGLVALAIFLFLMVFLSVHSLRDILVNITMASAGAIVMLQFMYEKYRPTNEESPDKVKPIFWNALSKFQNIRRTTKLTIVFITMILPLLIAKLFEI